MRMFDETDRLFQALSDDNTESNLGSLLGQYSGEIKDEVVARAACTLEPPLKGRLLERLPNLLNERNRKDMVNAFIVNLGSPDAEVRRYSLRGLTILQDAGLADFALLSLRDDDGELVYEACKILLPNAPQDSRIRETLQDLYRARKNRDDFRSTLDLLRSQGITDRTVG
jgi:hypothetical protein